MVLAGVGVTRLTGSFLRLSGEGGTGRRPHARPTAGSAAGEAGGLNAVQKLLTNRTTDSTSASLSCLG